MFAFFLEVAILIVFSLSLAQSTFVTPILPISFFFDWNDPLQPFPSLVTEQCETINIKWSRSTAQGPNPTAPYVLQVYTSNFVQPFVIPAGDGLSTNWTVPFAPGTQYQICMFDKFGNTGGCQDKYTVIKPNNPVACPNVTFVPQLGVDAVVNNGPISQYGFVDQCTDISITPTNGTPPYTLTVAPSLHPPYNITSFDMSPINWTVSLNWAMPFFISLTDSNGSMWSNGPLHAGGGGTIGCLAGNVTSSPNVKVPIAVGVSVTALFIGAATATITLYLLGKRRQTGFVPMQDQESSTSRWIRSGSTRSEVNPFQITRNPDNGTTGSTQIFVLHQDNDKNTSQSPPVLRTADVVELPPRYPEYSPSEMEGINREMRLGRNPSTTIATNSGTGSTISSPDSERHYDPRGPLRGYQERRPTMLNRKEIPS